MRLGYYWGKMEEIMTERRQERTRWALACISWAAAYALLVVYADLLHAQRDPFWAGTPHDAWPFVALAAAGYFLSLAVCGAAAAMLLTRVKRLGRYADAGAAVGALAGAVVLWQLLQLPAGQSPMYGVRATGGLLALGTAALALRLATGRRLWVLGAVATLAAISAIALLETTGRLALADEAYWSLGGKASLSWFAVCALAGGLYCTGTKYQMKRLVRFAGIGALVPLVAQAAPAYLGPAGKRDLPNLVVITCDALRADYCSAYGGSVATPAMERLAQRGFLFESAHSTAPWTVPSVNGMMASRYAPPWLEGEEMAAWTSRVTRSFFDADDPTLAERLAWKGYATAAYLGNPVLYHRGRLLRGFGQVRLLPMSALETTGPFTALPLLNAAASSIMPTLCSERPLDSTRRVAAYGEAFLRLNANRPLFLWLHFMDPHDPYSPPRQFYDGDYPYTITELEDGLTPADVPNARPRYEGEIRYADHAYGEVIGLLARLGIEDNTFVVLSSDHGEEMGEHGGVGHDRTFFEEVMHVPLIIAGPGITPGRFKPAVSMINLLPTLTALLGERAPETALGESLAPIIYGRGEPLEKPCFAQGNNVLNAPAASMVLAGRYKLVRQIEAGHIELYDLAQDPGETKNIARENPETVDALAQQLDQFETLAAEDLTTGADSTGGEHLRGIAEEQLKAVGYLE